MQDANGQPQGSESERPPAEPPLPPAPDDAEQATESEQAAEQEQRDLASGDENAS